MKKILMIDYYGMCDSTGQAVGHSPKVLKEYAYLIKDDYHVSVAASPCLLKGIDGGFQNEHELRYDISTVNEQSVIKRIIDKLKLFYNIHEVLKIDGYDVYWFYKTDFFLFFFIWLRGLDKRGKKFIAQIYQDSFGTGKVRTILNWIYHKGMLKFDGIIYTQKSMQDVHPNTLYIPDYYYDTDKYGKYQCAEKAEKVVCLGTMNPYKQLEELVNAFNENGMSLEIRGFFYDKDQYRKIMNTKKHNIIIEDRVLSEEEYYRTLAGAKYAVLPYDMQQYQCRTSGVLQECLFLDTIPIAPALLLNQNSISGMGYDSIKELSHQEFFEKGCPANQGFVPEEYEKSSIKQRIVCFLGEEIKNRV